VAEREYPDARSKISSQTPPPLRKTTDEKNVPERRRSATLTVVRRIRSRDRKKDEKGADPSQLETETEGGFWMSKRGHTTTFRGGRRRYTV